MVDIQVYNNYRYIFFPGRGGCEVQVSFYSRISEKTLNPFSIYKWCMMCVCIPIDSYGAEKIVKRKNKPSK